MDDIKKYVKENRKTALWLFGASLVAVVVFVAGATAIGMVVSGIRGSAAVIKQELNPQELNEKYEWFKDAYASLDAKKANIDVFDNSVTENKELYGEDANEWPMLVRADYLLNRNEVKAMKASYNRLAGSYNAEMAKWHTSFVNVGRLPQGGGGEIPREVADYTTE